MEKTLDIFNENVIKWYDFKKTENIIQIGKCENITEYLKTIFKEVIVVENFENFKILPKYDYVLIYESENKLDLLEEATKCLNEEGILLLIGANPFGINNWSKYNIDGDTGIINLENHSKENLGILKIKDKIAEKGLKDVNTFYIFPNYKYPEVIINENFKIGKSHIEKYTPQIEENEIKLFDEIKVLKNIIKNDSKMLDFFVNSYLIEASKKEIQNEVKYISFNNCRKDKYRLITIIKDDVVEKRPANKKAEEHIKKIVNNISNLKNQGIELLDYEENGKIYSKLVKEYETLDRILYKKRDNLNDIAKILNEIKEILLNNSIETENGLHMLEHAYWDMAPKNCFYIDGKYVFFDQEWEKENLSVEFIIYRSIINCYDLVRKINVDELLEKLNILQYKQDFEIIDEEIRREIIDEEIFDKMYNKKNTAIDNLINDNKIALTKIEQLEEDNSNKQKYIEGLEARNKILEEENAKNQKRLSRRGFFWKK